MDIEMIIGVVLVVIVLLILAVLSFRNMNHGYTIGSGLFKSSDSNLEKDKKLDPSDYNYYDSKGKYK